VVVEEELVIEDHGTELAALTRPEKALHRSRGSSALRTIQVVRAHLRLAMTTLRRHDRLASRSNRLQLVGQWEVEENHEAHGKEAGVAIMVGESLDRVTARRASEVVVPSWRLRS
jgi:hypothetical protein